MAQADNLTGFSEALDQILLDYPEIGTVLPLTCLLISNVILPFCVRMLALMTTLYVRKFKAVGRPMLSRLRSLQDIANCNTHCLSHHSI